MQLNIHDITASSWRALIGLQDGCPRGEAAEAVDLRHFTRYKFRYLSQYVEYNSNQCVLRQETLSSDTYPEGRVTHYSFFYYDKLNILIFVSHISVCIDATIA